MTKAKRTPQKVDRAIRLYGASRSTRAVARVMQVDHTTVSRWLAGTDTTMRALTDDRRVDVPTERILALRAQGLSIRAVAAQVGMSPAGVHGRLTKHRAPARTETKED